MTLTTWRLPRTSDLFFNFGALRSFYIAFVDVEWILMQDAHWIDLGVSQSDVSAEIADVSETERKRREAVWELFRSECVFLIDHLMVLKHVSALQKLIFSVFDLLRRLEIKNYYSVICCKWWIFRKKRNFFRRPTGIESL